MMDRITLIPITEQDHKIYDYLSIVLSETFTVPCSVSTSGVSLVECFLHERDQYHSTKIISEILKGKQKPNEHILGIVKEDICIPILTFVFGEAQLKGPAAVISTARLKQSFYGLPEDDVLFLQRCEKESIHELGHTLGLVHCQEYSCVMHYANTVEDIDIKESSFCDSCQSLVRP